MPKLHVKHPEMGKLTFAIAGERVSVGRRADNAIQINHATVSGHHGEFVAVNGHYVFHDLKSTNHTFVNGKQVEDADLATKCRLTIGTIECEYVPDPPLAALAKPATSEDAEELRKIIGGLRQQNDDLVSKLTDQQHQIEILGSAHLLTPAAGADINSLREKVRALGVERDKLVKENSSLHAEVERLRGIVALGGDPGSRKATSPVAIARESDNCPPTIVVAPDGAASPAAPVAKVADGVTHWFDHVVALNEKLKAMLTRLVRHPNDMPARSEVWRIATEMVGHVSSPAGHPVSRISKGLESVARDAVTCPGEFKAGLLRTLNQGSDLISAIAQPGMLYRCDALPCPSILVVDDDRDLLPAVVTALDFALLRTSGSVDATHAISILREQSFDLVLLDLNLPDINGMDACSMIRALPRHGRTPLVFLTGRDDLETRERCTSKGGTDFVGKPFNMFELTLKATVWAYRNQLGLV